MRQKESEVKQHINESLLRQSESTQAYLQRTNELSAKLEKGTKFSFS